MLPFHNVNHTKEVVANVKKIALKENVNNDDIEILIIAAWFHDTGFSEVYNGHEEVSKKIAKDFLLKQYYDVLKIKRVLECIEATKMPQKPKNELSKIICDADIFHISTPNFFYRKLLLRREWEIFCDMKVTDLEWHKLNLKFLEDHKFKTHYGKKYLEKRKEKNIEKCKKNSKLLFSVVLK